MNRSGRTSSTLRSFDLYRKIPLDLQSSSVVATPLSLITLFLMTILLLAETYTYLSGTVTWDRLVLDSPSLNTGGISPVKSKASKTGKIMLEFNITMLDMSCDHIEIDVFDDLGTKALDIKSNIERWSVDAEGKRKQYRGRNKSQNDVVHDHDSEGGNNIHGTIESLHADGVHAVDIKGEEGLKEVLKNDFAFVDFYAPWCIWCQRLEPAWERLGETTSFPSTVIGKVDCVENAEMCRKKEHGIRAFPTLRMYHKGEKWGGDYKGDRTVQAMKEFLVHAREETEEGGEEEKFERLKKNTKKRAKKWNEEDHPGCMFVGYIWVNKIPGRLQIEARNGFQNIDPKMANLSHSVNKLGFGTQVARRNKRLLDLVPSGYKNLNTMDGNWYVTSETHEAFHHFVHVAPTRHHNAEDTGYIVGTTTRMFGSFMNSVSGSLGVLGIFGRKDQYFDYNQMSHSSQKVEFTEAEIPSVEFGYDVNPLVLLVGEKQRLTFLEYIVRVMAIVGGVYALLGLIDRGVDSVSKKTH